MGLNLNLNINGAKRGLATPPVPTDVVITVVSDTAFSIAYVSAFPVEFWYSTTEGGVYTKHGDSASTPYPMTGLTAGTLYYVKIRSINGSKFSAFGSAVSATTYAPYFSDALFLLNGDIVTIGESIYFQDKTANARNFLITGYDFTSTWTKGFPYKSAATISAPADDAALIAADINNYLYASDGTPNQILVVSLIQDVDYEHKLFCKHLPQVVDVNGVETFEPRVVDIVLYANVKATTELTNCLTYFSVPTEIETAIWVAKTGDDTNGDGTKTKPYLTIVKAYTVATGGKTIYVKTGAYTETVYSLTDCQLQCIGFVDFIPNSGGYGIRWRYDTKKLIAGIKINKGNAVTAGIYGQASTDLELKKIYLESDGTSGIVGDTKLIQNVIFKGSNTISISNTVGTQTRVIDTCLFLSAAASLIYIPNLMGKITVKNCKVDSVSGTFVTFLNTANGVDIIGNTVEIAAPVNYIKSSGNLALLQILYNTFIINNGSSNPILIEDHVTNVPIIKDNTFVISNDVDDSIVYSENSALDVENNIFNLSGEIVAYAEIQSLLSDTNTYSCFKAINNKIHSKRIGGYNIAIGSESTGNADNDVTLIEIKNNYIKGRHAYAEATTNGVHSKFVGFQINADIKYNFTWGAGYSAVIKGSSGTIYTEKGFTYNIEKEYVTGVYCKGSQSVPIYNNTFFSKDVTPQYGIRLADNTGSDAASNCKIKNNIFIYLGTEIYQPIQILNGGTDNESDYNIFYCPNGTLQFQNANGVRTFAQWQSDGYDVHSHILTDEEYNDLFNDVDNNDFSINVMPYSGVDLGAAYDDGLDASTDWGSETELPVVVTKQQGATWDIGAYVH